jgi:hypothetical protein
MASEHFTIQGKAQKKLKKLRDNKADEKNSFRYKRLIAETVKIILKNNTELLSNNDIKQISLKVYNKYDKLKHLRVRNQLNSLPVKQDINAELQRILTDKGIKPLLKSVELIEKGETVAKTTSDYVQLSKMYKEFAQIEPIKATETREYTDFSAYKEAKDKGLEPVPDKITQKITVTSLENDGKTRENTSAPIENKPKTQESTVKGDDDADKTE